MTPAELTVLLRRAQFRVSSESALQDDIETRLLQHGVDFQREHRLGPADRPDFLVVGGIVIEAKARCSRRVIYRQLQRYAMHDTVTAIVLVTGTAMGLPPTLGDKPLFYVSLGRGAL